MFDFDPVGRVGPFNTQEPAAWLFPSGLLLLAAATIGYAWLIGVIAFSDVVTCTMQLPMALLLAGTLGTGAALLAATAFRPWGLKVGVVFATFPVTFAAGFIAVVYLYTYHCMNVIPFFRQQLGIGV